MWRGEPPGLDILLHPLSTLTGHIGRGPAHPKAQVTEDPLPLSLQRCLLQNPRRPSQGTSKPLGCAALSPSLPQQDSEDKVLSLGHDLPLPSPRSCLA